MSLLSVIALAVGGVIGLLGLACAASPERARACIEGFPRNVWAGRILTAVDLAWAGWLLYQAPLGRFDAAKPVLVVLVPIAIVAVVNLVDELLAARALGGLLLLVPAPLLDAARWHESGLRRVVVVLAYLLVLKGMLLVLSPYRFRKIASVVMRGDKACRLVGLGGLALGVLLAVLAVTVY